MRSIFHAVRNVFYKTNWGIFCAVFACFLRPFPSISSIFNSSKHIPIFKKWPIQQGHVLTIVILPKAMGRRFQKKLIPNKKGHTMCWSNSAIFGTGSPLKFWIGTCFI